MKELAKIDPREVKEYYIDQHHSLLQTAEHFGRSQSGMEKFLKRNGIKKTAEEVLEIKKRTAVALNAFNASRPPMKSANCLDDKMPSADVLREEYMNCRGQKVLAELYGVSVDTIRKWLRKCGIEKTSAQIVEARKSTVKGHFGCEFPMQSEEVRRKSRETTMVKYGVDYYQKTEEARMAISKANRKEIPDFGEIRKYYVDESHSIIDSAAHFKVSVRTMLTWLAEGNIHKTNEQKTETKRKTCRERFGCDSASASPLVQEAHRKACLEKYGYDHPVRKGLEKAMEVLSSEEAFVKFITMRFGDKPNYTMVAKELGCSATTVKRASEKNGWEDYFTQFASSQELELRDFLDSIGVAYVAHDRSVLNGLEIDLYVPSKKIGIEFNGDYWHSSAIKAKNYHFDKSKLAESKGVRLIHIYEYEWNTMKDKIIQLLKIALGVVNSKIYARKCEVHGITNQEAKILNDKVHLQGHRDAQVTYGLYYHGELVQLMSFSKTHYNRNIKGDNSWEIIRGCPGSNNVVVGGVSKLFSHFIKECDPDEVFSYCDFNKFDGKSYEAIGMKFIGYTGPDKTYLIDGVAYKRNPSKYKEYKEKAEAVIWGAGSKKYLWKKEESL